MIISKWKAGTESLHKADPQKVAEEILSIGETFTPQEIVDKARDESTELHKCFTWDDTKAAEKWRKYEARQIICHLVIQRPAEDEEGPEVRLIHKTDRNQGYQPTAMIVRRESEYSAMLQRALGELRAFQYKYSFLSDYEELKKLIDAVETMIDAA